MTNSTFRESPTGRPGCRRMSCFSSLCVVLIGIVHASIADAAEKSSGVMTVGAIDTGRPRLTIVDGESKHVYKVSPNVKVFVNGVAATIDDLSLGDAVSIERDGDQVTEIRATRFKSGIVLTFGEESLEITSDYTDRKRVSVADDAQVLLNGREARVTDLQRGDRVQIAIDPEGRARKIDVSRHSLLEEFWDNFRRNLFKPLLLFFYLGFIVPLLKVEFEFPHVMYQGLTIYLLLSIGWHGGEELAELSGSVLQQAVLFMCVGFCTNFVIGIVAYGILRRFIPRMRRVDAATVSAYYGSDSAGTFVTCLGVLAGAGIAYAAYMPVMLAIMEIPGCLVGLWLVSGLRQSGMDRKGNMPDEPGYNAEARSPLVGEIDIAENHHQKTVDEKAVEREARMALENREDSTDNGTPRKRESVFSAELLHEVFLNPGLFLLFGGILIGFVSRLQGHKVTDADDSLFVTLFQGMLCLFLLEMGMTASRRLMDLRTAGWRFIVFGLVAPNLFATAGILVAHTFGGITGYQLQLGTYVLFAVLCGAASYIAVPAIQRLAIPEASPTLPLAASLGLTFSYNVTVGIPIYLIIAQRVIMSFPIGGH